MRPTLTLLLLTFYGTCGRAQAYEVNVHPGQEILTMIQILADRYRAPNESDYEKDFREHFTQYTDHPAVVAMATMSERVYTDFPELGWCISNFPTYDLYLPEENSRYELYGKDTVQQVLRLAVDFARDTDFWAFYQQHASDYQKWGEGVRQVIDSLGYARKLAAFYRLPAESPRAKFYIALDPLNSWGAHAVPHLDEINPQFADYKAYSLGYWNRESTRADSPSFSGTNFLSNLVWHEGSHIYLDDLLKRHAELIQEIAYLHNGDEPKMRRQNIDTWSYCFEENLVRGVVIALSRQHLSRRKYKEAVAKEWSSGFIYAEDMADWLAQNYLSEPDTRLEEILPDLVRHLDATYEAIPK